MVFRIISMATITLSPHSELLFDQPGEMERLIEHEISLVLLHVVGDGTVAVERVLVTAQDELDRIA